MFVSPLECVCGIVSRCVFRCLRLYIGRVEVYTHGNEFICRKSQNVYTWEGWCRACIFAVSGVGVLFYFDQKDDDQKDLHTVKTTSGFYIVDVDSVR